MSIRIVRKTMSLRMFLQRGRGMAMALGLSLASVMAASPEPCRIEVVEKGSGWPVPLVELRTTHQVRLVTDNAGVIALDLPELMGRETWFDVSGHGYEVAKDGFGSRGVRLKPEPGKTLKVEVTRTIIARRLGRAHRRRAVRRKPKGWRRKRFEGVGHCRL